MNQAVRAVIIHDNKLLVMHRNKFGKEYDTLVGGGVQPGESLEQALYRELHEETGVQIGPHPRLVFVEDDGAPNTVQQVFWCEYVSGEPALRPDSDEAQINQAGENLYIPQWLPLAELPSATFISERLKQAILAALKNGLPAGPQTL